MAAAPQAWDYSTSDIPSPLTDEMEAAQQSKKVRLATYTPPTDAVQLCKLRFSKNPEFYLVCQVSKKDIAGQQSPCAAATNVIPGFAWQTHAVSLVTLKTTLYHCIACRGHLQGRASFVLCARSCPLPVT